MNKTGLFKELGQRSGFFSLTSSLLPMKALFLLRNGTRTCHL